MATTLEQIRLPFFAGARLSRMKIALRDIERALGEALNPRRRRRRMEHQARRELARAIQEERSRIEVETRHRIADAVSKEQQKFLGIGADAFVLRSPDANLRAAKQRALSLADQLFCGYEDSALEALTTMLEDPNTDKPNRSSAAWALARWYMSEKQPELSLRCLEVMRHAAPEEASLVQPTILQIGALLELPDLRLGLVAAIEANRRWGKRTEIEFMVANAFADLGDYGAQIEWLNKSLRRRSLASIVAPTEAPASFDRIVTSPRRNKSKSDKLLSIIMPVRNAAETIATAIESIRAQTWVNFEVIVLDDASTDNTWRIIEKFANVDKRIKPHKIDKQRGAYAARNVGLSKANGAYITTHDADDWSHPQKFDVQIGALLEEGCFNMSSAAIFDKELRVMRRPASSRLMSFNYSSLLIRREHLDEIGGWDEVKVSADLELVERLSVRFGEKFTRVMPDTPLSFLSAPPRSLTRLPVTGIDSVRFGARREYYESFRHWHRRESEKDSPNFVLPRGKRPFPVPNAISVQGKEAVDREVVIFGDHSAESDTRTLVSLWQKAIGVGVDFAFFHLPTPNNVKASVDSAFRDMAMASDVLEIVAGETVRARTIVLVGPECIGFEFSKLPAISAENGVVVSSSGESVSDEGSATRFHQVFGVSPRTGPIGYVLENILVK